MSATETVEEYYEALRRGEPLSPFFAEREDVVKFGISERLDGYEAVAEGLREQTRTTEEWRVESRDLRVNAHESVERESVTWFTDGVDLSWTETDGGTRRSFDTRWSGVLEREGGRNEDGSYSEDDERRWQFVRMHVSAPHEL
jgi:hypothetical protein